MPRCRARGRSARVRTKARIDIHAEGPDEIALSIMAEIIAERHRNASRDGTFMRDS